ncbi:hypothetical protein V6Z12_D11G259800 [Gossypium hirsutum]
MLVGTLSWYPNLGATHHVCRNASALHDSIAYSGTSSLLMGDGTPTKISFIDIMTREILLRGHIRDGLYHFSPAVASAQSVEAPSTTHIGL